MQEKDVISLLKKLPGFFQKAISVAEEAKEMCDDDIIPISKLNYLHGYLNGGLEVIRWYLEKSDD